MESSLQSYKGKGWFVILQRATQVALHRRPLSQDPGPSTALKLLDSSETCPPIYPPTAIKVTHKWAWLCLQLAVHARLSCRHSEV